MPVMDIDTLREISSAGMNNFQKTLEGSVPAGIEVEQKTEFAILSEEIKHLQESTGAELVVIGITGASKIEEIFVGSTATSVVKHSPIPVIVVPADAKAKTVKNVMFACDYKKVVETTPAFLLKKFLTALGASLHVVNVYEGEKEISGDKMYQQELLSGMLDEFQPQFHSIKDEHFVDGINRFVDEHGIDMIITIPRKHGFFEELFNETHTKKLAFHSHVPLMFIHEQSAE
jgi:hypothetical protein